MKVNYNRLASKFERAMSKPRRPLIAVIGDVMLDTHVTCDVAGISPEDDLAYKLKPTDTNHRPGGAGNVATNLLAMGAHVTLHGSISADAEAWTLCNVLQTRYGMCTHYLRSWSPMTTHKIRYLTKHNRHIIRVDREKHHELQNEEVDGIVDEVVSLKPKLVVVSDYNKGVVNARLMDRLRASGLTFIVDPKKGVHNYCGALAITPNQKEYESYFPTEDGVPRLLQKAKISYLVAKLAERGAMVYCDRLGYRGAIPAHQRTHGDPAGCGDSLIAGLAVGLALGWSMDHAVRLGVAAGSCSFDHTGVYSVTVQDIIKELSKGEANG